LAKLVSRSKTRYLNEGAVPKESKISCQPPFVRHNLYIRPQMAAKIAALQIIRQPLFYFNSKILKAERTIVWS